MNGIRLLVGILAGLGGIFILEQFKSDPVEQLFQKLNKDPQKCIAFDAENKSFRGRYVLCTEKEFDSRFE